MLSVSPIMWYTKLDARDHQAMAVGQLLITLATVHGLEESFGVESLYFWRYQISVSRSLCIFAL